MPVVASILPIFMFIKRNNDIAYCLLTFELTYEPKAHG